MKWVGRAVGWAGAILAFVAFAAVIIHTSGYESAAGYFLGLLFLTLGTVIASDVAIRRYERRLDEPARPPRSAVADRAGLDRAELPAGKH